MFKSAKVALFLTAIYLLLVFFFCNRTLSSKTDSELIADDVDEEIIANQVLPLIDITPFLTGNADAFQKSFNATDKAFLKHCSLI